MKPVYKIINLFRCGKDTLRVHLVPRLNDPYASGGSRAFVRIDNTTNRHLAKQILRGRRPHCASNAKTNRPAGSERDQRLRRCLPHPAAAAIRPLFAACECQTGRSQRSFLVDRNFRALNARWLLLLSRPVRPASTDIWKPGLSDSLRHHGHAACRRLRRGRSRHCLQDAAGVRVCDEVPSKERAARPETAGRRRQHLGVTKRSRDIESK